MNFKSIGIIALPILATLSLGAAYNRGLGFSAPTINGKDNVSNAVEGEIVFDVSDRTFYGYSEEYNRDDPWMPLGGPGAGVPPGSIMPYGGATAPAGWLLCDGASLVRDEHPALFTAISTNFGSADGTHFNLPDLRGRFLRGVDDGAGLDPDAGSRSAMATGGAVNDNVGSVQGDAFDSHTHGPGSYTVTGLRHLSLAYSYAPSSTVDRWSDDYTTMSGTASVLDGASSASGGNETRPTNAYVNYIIKL